MKKILLLSFIALALLTACEKGERVVCTKIVTTFVVGVQTSSDTSKIVSFKGSYAVNELTFDDNGRSTMTRTVVDCDCD